MTTRIRNSPQTQSRRNQEGAGKAEVKRQNVEVEAAWVTFVEAPLATTFLFLVRFAIG